LTNAALFSCNGIIAAKSGLIISVAAPHQPAALLTADNHMQPGHPEQQQLPQPRLLRSMRPLLFLAVLAMCCVAGSAPAAAHRHNPTHTPPAGRSLQATNRTARAAAGCGAKLLSPEVRQLLRERLEAVNAAEAAKAAAAAAAASVGEVGSAATPMFGLQRGTSINMGLDFHVISDPNVQVHVDSNGDGAVDAGEMFSTAPHRAGSPGDLPTCAHLNDKLLPNSSSTIVECSWLPRSLPYVCSSSAYTNSLCLACSARGAAFR
jgi:hypothetical protein